MSCERHPPGGPGRFSWRRRGAMLAAAAGSCWLAIQASAHVFQARGTAELSDQFRIELAESAEPLWQLVEDEGVSLRDTLTALCGEQGEQVDEYLASRAVELNRVASVDDLIPPGSTVAVPFCFKISGATPVPIESGDTVERLLTTHYGLFDEATLEDVYQLNAPNYPGLPMEEFVHRLRPGTELILPYVAEMRTFTMKPGLEADTTLIAMAECMPECGPGAPMMTGLEVVYNFSDPDRFQSVPFVEAAAAAGGGCGITDYSQPTADLAARYSAEKSALMAAGGKLENPIVGIVDTGLAREDAFFAGLLERNEGEEGGTENSDDDDNGFVDDVLGAGLESSNGWIYSSPTDNPVGHGTKVATVVAAGLDFEVWRARVPDSPLRLKMVSYSSQLPISGVNPAVLSGAPPYLQKQNVAIVNMSLSSVRNPLTLTIAIRGSDNLLFVVAAGNVKSGKGKLLGPAEVYPALYGGRAGDFAKTMLTVGAHDQTGTLATFSNYSREHVDLLAPGCSVKTRDESGNQVNEHGTSMATAAVSFTAALVRSLWRRAGPAGIKNRILAATDYDPRLANHAWSSGRLNPRKAISLRHDVVETADGLLFGKLQDPGAILRLCKREPQSPLERVRKIVPNIQKPNHVGIEYWVERNERLYRIECEQIDGAPEVGLVADDGAVNRVPLAAIRDIVQARL